MPPTNLTIMALLDKTKTRGALMGLQVQVGQMNLERHTRKTRPTIMTGRHIDPASGAVC